MNGTLTSFIGFMLLISLYADKSVFRLVLIAWGLLASAFVPLMLVYALNFRPSELLALIMVLSGITVFLAWRWLGLSTFVYEILPGMLAGLLVFIVLRGILKGHEATD